MLVGYARVSSSGQSLDLQEEQLRAAGCGEIFAEKRSGRSGSERPELERAVQFVREGDTLVVTRLDRLARSVGDLFGIVERLSHKGVGFRALQQAGVDTETSTGKLTLAILGAVAEFENDIRRERQREGIEKAKERGVYRGRPPSVDRQAIAAALASGEKPSAALARKLGIARSTLYLIARETGEGAIEAS
jgi:DNA invertase Pin-like site-specific DNA recombinase